MQLGDRIKVPARLFSSEYAEMRLCGKYEAAVLPAILFRLMELCVEQSHLPENHAYNSLVKLLSSDYEAANQALAVVNQRPVNKAGICEALFRLVQSHGPRIGLSPNNPASFQGITQTAGFSINCKNYFGKIGENTQGVEVDFGLSNSNGMLFLLYPNYTLDSFLDCSCGRYNLKNHYYQLLQERFGPQAIAYDSFAAANLCCPCSKDLTELIYYSCFEEQYAASNSTETGYYCAVCRKPCREDEACGDHWCCGKCYGKNYFTGNYRWTPCCRRQIEEEKIWELRDWIEKQCPYLQTVIENLKHDKPIRGRFKLPVQHAKAKSALTDPPISPPPLDVPPAAVKDERQRDELTNPLPTPPLASQPIASGNEEKREEGLDPLPESIPSQPEDLSDWDSIKAARIPPMPDLFALASDQTPSIRSPKNPVKPNEENKTLPLKAEKGLFQHEKPVLSVPMQVSVQDDVPDVDSPTIHPEDRDKREKCATCDMRYIDDDKTYQCPNACQCKYCIIQALTGHEGKENCDICGAQYQMEHRSLATSGHRRCHVCEMAVDITELETGAACSLCRDCVLVTENSFLGFTTSVKGTCICNPSDTFDIDGSEYKKRRSAVRVSACCGRQTPRRHTLTCGHIVCGTHGDTLKTCRTCHKPANKQQMDC